MKIAAYLPRLTTAELDRCWMPPSDVCELAVVGDIDRPEVRRFLSNVSDRGYLPFTKSGAAKTSPKLYSVSAAIGLRVFREITTNGRPYEFAAPVAKHCMDLARQLVTNVDRLDALDTGHRDWLVVFQSNHRGDAVNIRTVRRDQLADGTFEPAFEFGLIPAADLIWNVLRHYADYWARDRIARGLDQSGGRYDGVDDNGHPLDPAHPWNANLPPLERARRLVEIEEYLARRNEDTS